jgi:hypothetical protein|uniref:Probable phage integrase n=1 Tax=Leptospirillum ferrodiazotrophum TaxID=412449 RepID=C6HV71_9BACT|nr:MAG: probable phage integrase [Leptospirillum ferrodiazotrophum]
MDRGAFFSRKEAENTTLSEALDRYLTEITEKKKGSYQESRRIENLKIHSLGKRFLATIKEETLQSIVTNGSQPSHQRLSEENLSSFRISSPLPARNGACQVLEIPSRPSGYLPVEEFPGIAA